MNEQKAKVTLYLSTDTFVVFHKKYTDLVDLTHSIVNSFDEIHAYMRYHYEATVELPDKKIYPWTFL